MNDMREILKNLALLVFSILISYYPFSGFFSKLYEIFSPEILPSSLFLTGEAATNIFFFSGFLLSYIFFVPLSFYLFTSRHRYWWIVGLLIPAVVIELSLSLELIYLPIISGILGWAVGYGLLKLKPLIFKR